MTRLAEAARDMRLMLVEDNHGDVLLFRRAVARLGLNIALEVAVSGEAALERLRGGDPPDRRHLPDVPDLPDLPDLIVTDLNLAQMSGLEFLETMKSDPALRRVPVLVMSSSTRAADIAGAYDRHASGYFVKPVDAEELIAALAGVVARR